MIEGGVDDARLTTAAGSVHTGADLLAIVREARDLMHQLESFNTRYDRSLLEQAAIVGGLDPEAVLDSDAAAGIGQRIAARLDRIADEVERGWTGAADGQGGMVFSRTVRGVTERHELDANLLASADARKLRQMIERTDGLGLRDVRTDARGQRDDLGRPWDWRAGCARLLRHRRP